MKFPEYPVGKTERNEAGMEQMSDVPIIDFVRHAETDYKQGEYKFGRIVQHKRQMLNPNFPGFALNSEYLDLSPEGISTMQETGIELLRLIDKDNELF
jgi:hypothetical protein